MKSSFFVSFVILLLISVSTYADSKKVKALKNQKAEIERGIQKNKEQLNKTRQQTVKKTQTADFIEDQLEQRLDYIHHLEREIDTLESNINLLEEEVASLERQVTIRKQKYILSLRQARTAQSLRSPLLFLFSAESFPQIYRRMRYAREFAALQKTHGLQLMAKEARARDKRNELLTAKQKRHALVQEVVDQRHQLAANYSIVKADVAKLQKQQKEIEQQVAAQQKQLNALTKKIDELIAQEIEEARKRAEAEARRKREAELAKSKGKGGGKGGTSSSSKGGTASKGKSTSSSQWLTSEERKLNGTLEQNKGRLPVPITGSYRIARRFGLNQITAGVTLDNKGTNYIGRSGARARAIFDGVVSAVFLLDGKQNVLIRHGSYISVYCNLSSTIVHRGQHVKSCDILGTVAEDGQGDFMLHFQLRKETTKLNPESWIGK